MTNTRPTTVAAAREMQRPVRFLGASGLPLLRALGLVAAALAVAAHRRPPIAAFVAAGEHGAEHYQQGDGKDLCASLGRRDHRELAAAGALVTPIATVAYFLADLRRR